MENMNALGFLIMEVDWMGKDEIGLTNGKEFIKTTLNETKEIEISIIGWWCVWDNDNVLLGIYPTKEDIPIGLQTFQIRQIAKKIPFNEGQFLVNFKRSDELGESEYFNGTLEDCIKSATCDRRHRNYDRKGVLIYAIGNPVFADIE